MLNAIVLVRFNGAYVMVLPKFPRPISGRKLPKILEEPIERPPSLILALYAHGMPDEVVAKIYKESADFVEQQEALRLKALAAHYGVDVATEGYERQLLFRLAEDFIGGFCDSQTIKSGAGRPKATTDDEAFELYADVSRVMKIEGYTLTEACKHWKNRRTSRWHGKNLNNMAQMFRRTERAVHQSYGFLNRDPFYKKLYDVIAPFKPEFGPRKTPRKKGKAKKAAK